MIEQTVEKTTIKICKTKTVEIMSTKLLTINDLSTDIAADSTSDVKAATPKAVADYVGVVPKKYVALLTQSGTDAPVATVLENTLGGEVVWVYIEAGVFNGLLLSAFTENKTVLFPMFDQTGSGFNPNNQIYRVDANTVAINTDGDGQLANHFVEINVYI